MSLLDTAPETDVTSQPSGAARLRRRVDPAPWLGLIGTLVAFELASRSGLVDSRYLPPVTDIMMQLVRELGDATTWSNIGLTMQGWALGLLIATLIGVPVGLLAGTSDVVFHAIRPIVEFLRPVPSVALVPLAVIAFGAGMESKVFLAAFAATWPVMIHSLYGVRDLDPTQLATARSYRLRRRDVFFGIIIPSSVPYVVTGLRIASATALALAVTAELIIGAPGIGQQLNIARASAATDSMYAFIILAGGLGWLVNIAFVACERRVLHWHPSHREISL